MPRPTHYDSNPHTWHIVLHELTPLTVKDELVGDVGLFCGMTVINTDTLKPIIMRVTVVRMGVTVMRLNWLGGRG